MAVAVALLAVFTSAATHGPSDVAGAKAGPLAVGIAADRAADLPAPSTAATKGRLSAPAAAVGRATTTTTTTVAPATTVAQAAEAEAAAEEEPVEPDPDPAPAPSRTITLEAPPPPPVLVGLTRLPSVEADVFSLTNLDRAANRLPPVARDGCLDGQASAWAHAMAEAVTMAHSATAGGAVEGCRGAGAYWGDNIGYWQPCLAADMEAWWMGSPSHRPHILDPTYRAVGIGVWAEPNGRCWFQVYFGS